MKKNQNNRLFSVDPAINVVVYAEPGPSDAKIERHSRIIVKRQSTCGTGGGLSYLVLHRDDFGRIWAGVDCGDAFGTAAAVLQFLGPDATQFIGRHDDFIYGWVGDDQDKYGRVLLLQIIPRPHVIAARNVMNN